jgi:hypothetical protein
MYPRRVVGAVLVPVLVGVATTFLVEALRNPPPELEMGEPEPVLMSQRDYLDEAGIPRGETPPEDLRKMGLAIRANLTVRGHDGKKLPVICSLRDETSGRLVGDTPGEITVSDDKPFLATPCWIELPGPRAGHRFRAEVRLSLAPDDPLPLSRSKVWTAPS